MLPLEETQHGCKGSEGHAIGCFDLLISSKAGKSFYDILNAIRIQKAKDLLSDPKLKIGEIGELVGYADTAHFACTFKKLEGMSVNEYRNGLKR